MDCEQGTHDSAAIRPSGIAQAMDLDWAVRYEENEQAWVVSWQDIRRVRIPVGGARAYRHGGSRVVAAECRQDKELLVADSLVRIECGSTVTFHVRDVVRCAGDTIELHRSWWHDESASVGEVEFVIEVVPDGLVEEHLVPGCLYDGNAGAAPDRLVARFAGTTLFEEHKCPTPMVYAGCLGHDGGHFGLALFPAPGAVVDGHVPDQWWSLGFGTRPTGPTLLSVSGRLAVNGEDERIYDAQNHVSPYPDAWVDARPRHVYEKHVRLQLQADRKDAWGWRGPLRRVIAAQPPPTDDGAALISAPALEEAVRLKVGYALRRWHEDEHCAGMLWYPTRPEFAAKRKSIEYGWVGQNMRLGLVLWRWGHRCEDADLQQRGMRCAEAWVRAADAAFTEGRVAPTHYLVGKGWRDTMGGEDGYARPTAETLLELAEFCRRVREAGAPRADWERTLNRALEFYSRPVCLGADGLWPLKWDRHGVAEPGPTVTAGVLMVAAMAEAAALPGGVGRLDHAVQSWTRYAAVFLGTTPRHPCGSALDSCCEDMESGMFLLISALRLAEGLRRAGRPVPERLTAQARQAADWVLSWAYTWDVPLLPGTLLASAGFATQGWSAVSSQNRCCHPHSPAGPALGLAADMGRFSSRGLSDVSVQNRHLHVYSASGELLRLSTTGDEDAAFYATQAHRMLVPLVRTIARPGCRWGMDEDGEQTEQYNQTNYIQHPWDPVCRPRGGIARWFVPWITVWVLSVCLDFLERAPGARESA